VEANALVVRIDAGRQLFKATLDKYLDYVNVDLFNSDTELKQREVELQVQKLMKVA